MNRKLKNAVDHWLRVEQDGRDQEADQALMQVFSRLPEEAIPRGFADQVMRRAGLAFASTPSPAWAAKLVVRIAVSLCLLLGALSLLALPSYLPSLLGIFNLARITEFGVGSLVSVLHQLGSGLVIWRALSAAGSILSTTLSSPAFLALMSAAALLSFGAFRVLHEIVVSERSSRYV